MLEQKPDLDGKRDEAYINGRFVPVLVVEGIGGRPIYSGSSEIRREHLIALFESRFGGAWRAHKSAVA